MDQRHILTLAKLRLSPEIRIGERRSDVLTIKYIPARTYLNISEEHWAILQRFRHETTVSKVLPQLILDRECPPLRTFYELILKAVQAGVLQERQTTPPQAVKALDWRFKCSPATARFFAYTCMLFGVGALLFDDIVLPQVSLHLLLGWLLACLAISLGKLFATCVLRAGDGEVYDLRMHWRTLLPHVHVDLSDVQMVGRGTEASVHLAQMAPVFLLGGLAVMQFHSLEYLALVGIFFITDPFGNTPGVGLIRALYRDPRLSTDGDFVFVQNRLFWTVLNSKVRFGSRSYLLIYGAYVLLWLSILFSWNLHILQVNANELITALIHSRGFQFCATTLTLMLLGCIGFGAGMATWIVLKNLQGLWTARSTVRRKVKLPSTAEVSRPAIIELLRASLLFERVDDSVLEDVADAVEVVQVRSGKDVVREGDHGEHLFIVFSGRVEVLKDNPSGRPSVLATLAEGDVFGEIALLQNVPRTRTVRALRRSVLLTLSREAFQKLIVDTLGAGDVQLIVQRVAFLERLPLTRSWPPQALQKFARMATVGRFAPGERILTAGQDNAFFYIIYEGSFDIQVKGKRVARLGIGEFFGEISLLQNSVITADVLAHEASTCLMVHKSDFLRFLGEDFMIGIYFEDISSKRLKEPIFPLRGKSFDAHDAR